MGRKSDDPRRRRGPMTAGELAELSFEAGAPPLGAYARSAYEAYRSAAGGKSLVTGAQLPGWAELPEPIQAAWTAAAGIVLDMARLWGDR